MVQNVQYLNGQPSHVILLFEYRTPIVPCIQMVPVLSFLPGLSCDVAPDVTCFHFRLLLISLAKFRSRARWFQKNFSRFEPIRQLRLSGSATMTKHILRNILQRGSKYWISLILKWPEHVWSVNGKYRQSGIPLCDSSSKRISNRTQVESKLDIEHPNSGKHEARIPTWFIFASAYEFDQTWSRNCKSRILK